MSRPDTTSPSTVSTRAVPRSTRRPDRLTGALHQSPVPKSLLPVSEAWTQTESASGQDASPLARLEAR